MYTPARSPFFASPISGSATIVRTASSTTARWLAASFLYTRLNAGICNTATSAMPARRARPGRRLLRRLEIERLGERPVGVFADQQLAHEVDPQIGGLQ